MTHLVEGVGRLDRELVRAVVDLSGGGELGCRGGRKLTERSVNAVRQSFAESLTRLITSIIMQNSQNSHRRSLLKCMSFNTIYRH